MPACRIDDELVGRLSRVAKADRWRCPVDLFAGALQASADRAFAGKEPGAREVERYLTSLHLEDVALACACAAGDEAAWEHFILEHRPLLYRSADALDRSGGARELADSLYADLYGLQASKAGRQSLFRYFHGRSSLATWLRAVLAQRHVDGMRSRRRIEPLSDDDAGPVAAPAAAADPDRRRYLMLIQRALTRAMSRLGARDRLRLGCYYAQQLTLAETGRLLHEHEATVSRHLARSRRAIRQDVEHQLRGEAGLTDAQIAECFASVTQDPGPLDLSEIVEGPAAGPRPDTDPACKDSA